ncbi:efflux RND transporter periplasmic adaptor subunit [Myxococcus sp. CA051A]|uniref:Efflux RND transporter periplasmic adaptor subunit n=1 Tax=Myxococcus llanfairpwllgwyngyllgogerychwyrndrobwllllantysiliogogogochensis TaxID=2590453 RepID=A0A540WZZ6_9BACT|nr:MULTISPECIES: efflux RND transporter periplasmic adaptor subunit [Myxococcus]NTX02185.1 efflux RND transporter periplasmic adaptor subunit [Myxococcus sp. CA040A]NTX14349.1 efflux RND transporter periplasmic adaptor subunit [Myxococcus sp. CA056]NTX36981.1 efflux RND transporter periplasmic adaptor subunit [Myxococcus sp. CA033]NTX51388.1 efflux RND transporter periplasmic adaptor subunit [Myxococcus sp. CA039A]NTX64096.1 efflux RND transporter periplasmic adaptor subunit [Myxococcus sp. CA
MKWWKGAIAGALFLGAAAITAGGLKERPPPSQEVQIAKARKGTITRTITGAGKVQAATTVKISSSLSGDLVELLVKDGEPVKKGQVLGRIDKRIYEAAMKQAMASQNAARADSQVAEVEVSRTTSELGRVEGLVTKGLASGAELDIAKASKNTAEARLASARQQLARNIAIVEQAQADLSRTTLSSPIDGNVIELSREVGERVRGSELAEDVVMTIAALSAMEVKFEVGEHEVVHLKPGQPADVTLDALEGQTFQGSVVEIAQKALIKNPGTEAEVTSFPVTVALDMRPPGVLPGMSAEARISAETHDDVILVPIQAVTVRAERSLPDFKESVEGGALKAKRTETLAKVVFVVDAANKAQVRRVQTGIASDTELEILSGLSDGDRVVEGPYRTLSKELNHGDNVQAPEPGEGPGAKGGQKS